MTSRIDGQTDEQAEGDAIGSGKSGLERVLGLAQRRSSPQFEDARRCSRHKRLDSPRGGDTGTRRARRCGRAKVIWEMSDANAAVLYI